MEQENIGIGSRIRHKEMGKGVVIQVRSDAYLVTFVDYGTKVLSREHAHFEVIEAAEPADDLISFSDMEKALASVLRRFADVQEVVPIAEKWRNGRLILKPSDPDLKSYEMSIDSFFHKIVMVRDRLRVMEQRINSSDLPDDEKVNLQQYISRIYGSLTSFNVLFKNRQEDFTGIRK